MLIHTRCPIDQTDEFDVELYPANFDLADLTPETFSARRTPDRIHYRMVKSTRSNCVRADPILDEATVTRLYRASKVTYEPEAEYAAKTYLKYLERARRYLPDKRGVLEVGCGHGFFLKHMAGLGFERVAGVELSAHAVAKADPEIRPGIVAGSLQPGLFEDEAFSLICGFQVLDHLANPNETLQICRNLLAPRGVMFWICHDIASPFARLLGERCPVIDIQHVVLYDRKTVSMLFQRNGFEVLDVFGVVNRYPLSYWTSLAPMLKTMNQALLTFLKATRLGSLPLSANFGNLGILARKRVCVRGP